MSGSVAFISGNLFQISTILSSISTQNELSSRLQELNNLVNQATSLLDSINCPSLASLLKALLNNVLVVLNYLSTVSNDLTVVSGTSTIATILLSISTNLNSIITAVCQSNGSKGATGITGSCTPDFILSNLQTIISAITTNNFSSQDAINSTVANVIGPALIAISRCFQLGVSGPAPGGIPGVTGPAIVINIPVNNTNNNNITDRNSQSQAQQQSLYDFYGMLFNRCRCKRGYCGYRKCRKWWGRRPWWC